MAVSVFETDPRLRRVVQVGRPWRGRERREAWKREVAGADSAVTEGVAEDATEAAARQDAVKETGVRSGSLGVGATSTDLP